MVVGLLGGLVRGRWEAALRWTVLVLLAAVLFACVPDRPDQLIEADVVGVIARVDRHPSGAITLDLEDGQSVELPSARVSVYGSGLSSGQLLLYGQDFERAWYATLGLNERLFDGCYQIGGTAYDSPDAVILVPADWEQVGLRLPKAAELEMPETVVDSEGRFRMAAEVPLGDFCLDVTGAVFNLHMATGK